MLLGSEKHESADRQLNSKSVMLVAHLLLKWRQESTKIVIRFKNNDQDTTAGADKIGIIRRNPTLNQTKTRTTKKNAKATINLSPGF